MKGNGAGRSRGSVREGVGVDCTEAVRIERDQGGRA